MEIKVVSVTKTELGKKRMPSQFSELIRPDIIQRAVEAIQSNRRQPYGATPTAGKRASAKLSRRRRDFKTSYGIGISRVPRKIMSRSGTRFNWQAAFAPGAVGGRRSHPPKAEKIWKKKINVQERRKAIRSAMSATVVKELVQKRGHVVPEKYPFIVESRIESLQKTKQAIECLEKLGLAEELARASEKRVRAGIGKMRGRRYNTKKGPLIVVSGNCPLLKSAANIPGVDVCEVSRINAELLAPGADIGRLTIFTDAAVERLEKERLFTTNPIKMERKEQKAEKAEKKIPARKPEAKTKTQNKSAK